MKKTYDYLPRCRQRFVYDQRMIENELKNRRESVNCQNYLRKIELRKKSNQKKKPNKFNEHSNTFYFSKLHAFFVLLKFSNTAKIEFEIVHQHKSMKTSDIFTQYIHVTVLSFHIRILSFRLPSFVLFGITSTNV